MSSSRACSLAVAVLLSASLAEQGARVLAQGADGLVFEVYQDAAKEYRWRLKGPDGKDLASPGQGFKTKATARRSVEIIQTEAGGKLNFEVYEDRGKETRWRAKSPNGQVVASSVSGYKSKADCDRAVDAIKKGAAKAKVVELEPKK